MIEWTEARISEARTLWSQGLTAAQIGRQLSISRNAVIGTAYRHKFEKRNRSPRRDSQLYKELNVDAFIKAWRSADYSMRGMMFEFGCSEYFLRKKAKRLMLGKKVLPARSEIDLALHRQKKIIVHHDEHEKKCRRGRCKFLALPPTRYCYKHSSHVQ